MDLKKYQQFCQDIALIKEYFLKKKEGGKLSNLAAGMILDFFIKELSNDFYNQSVYAAIAI